jgi:hypothetical protein
MRRAGAGLIAAVLALAGCKSADTKAGDDKSSGGPFARAKKDKDKDKDRDAAATKTPWYDDVTRLPPGAGTDIPKGTGTIPTDPKGFAQEELSGRVLDPDGKPARGIEVRVEEVGAPRPPDGLDTAVYTNNEGYFRSPGKPGRTYNLTAVAATADGRKLIGNVQTTVPRSALVITLRDDLAPSGSFPPAPKPSDKVGGTWPPKPTSDGAWSPGGPAGTTPPATLGGGTGAAAPRPPAGGGVVPAPDESVFPTGPGPKPAARPENVANGTQDPLFRAPPANIPNAPPVPPLPALTLPPSAGSLVLLEFLDSTSDPCRQYLPVGKEMQSQYGARGLQLAGVICDNLPQKDRTAVAAKYGRDNDLNFAVYVEPGAAGSVCDKFDVKRCPFAVLLDSTGKVLWRGHAGDRAPLEAAIKQNLTK